MCGGGACVVGACMVGACMVGGHAWWGVYVAGGCGGGACMAGRMCGRGVCMGGVHGRGCAWQILRDTVNERVVGILLKCILVYLSNLKHKTLSQFDIFIIVQNIQHIKDCNNL